MSVIWELILYTVGLVAAEKITFENYKVFKIAATTQTQADFLNQLDEEVLNEVSKLFEYKETNKIFLRIN